MVARLDASPRRGEARRHQQCDKKGGDSGQHGPGYQCDEHSGSITRGRPKVMNVGIECEHEGTDCYGHGRVPRRRPRPVAKSKVLVGEVDREHHTTDDKGGQSPKKLPLTGRSRCGECPGRDSNAEVDHPDEYHCGEPSLAARV